MHEPSTHPLPSERVELAINFSGSVLSKPVFLPDLRQKALVLDKCVTPVFADLFFFKLFGFPDPDPWNCHLGNTVNSFLWLPLTFSFILEVALSLMLFASVCNLRRNFFFIQQVFFGCLLCTRNCGRRWWYNESEDRGAWCPWIDGLVGEHRTEVMLNQQPLITSVLSGARALDLWGPEQWGTGVWRGRWHLRMCKAATAAVTTLQKCWGHHRKEDLEGLRTVRVACPLSKTSR